MNLYYRTFWVAIFCIIFSIVAFATELPDPPQGYQWEEFHEIKGAFLKPLGWYYKKENKSGTWGYFITKENIDKEGEFTTGLTVNVVPDIPAKTGIQPSKYAAIFIQELIKSKKVVRKPWAQSMGPFESFGVVLLNMDSQKGDYITHDLAIGNDATGTLYIIVFEGPAESWDATWRIGEPMLQKFLIDSDI